MPSAKRSTPAPKFGAQICQIGNRHHSIAILEGALLRSLQFERHDYQIATILGFDVSGRTDDASDGLMIKIAVGATVLCLFGFGLGAGLTRLVDQGDAHGAANEASAPSSLRHSSQMHAPEGRSSTAR